MDKFVERGRTGVETERRLERSKETKQFYLEKFNVHVRHDIKTPKSGYAWRKIRSHQQIDSI